MPTSVISAFDSETAGRVVEELLKAGFPERDVAVLEGGEDELVGEIVARGFGRDDAREFAEAAGRGRKLVAAEVPEAKVDQAVAIMDRHESGGEGKEGGGGGGGAGAGGGGGGGVGEGEGAARGGGGGRRGGGGAARAAGGPRRGAGDQPGGGAAGAADGAPARGARRGRAQAERPRAEPRGGRGGVRGQDGRGDRDGRGGRGAQDGAGGRRGLARQAGRGAHGDGAGQGPPDRGRGRGARARLGQAQVDHRHRHATEKPVASRAGLPRSGGDDDLSYTSGGDEPEPPGAVADRCGPGRRRGRPGRGGRLQHRSHPSC